MTINRVAILGAGAMGAFYASRFADAGGFSTVLVADGHRYVRLMDQGLVVNGKAYAIPVVRPGDAGPPADLILVAVKHHDLESAVCDLRNQVGELTTIISVMNGLDSEAILAAEYGMDKVLYAVAMGIDAVRQGNTITTTTPGKILFGQASNEEFTQRVRSVQDAFDRAAIPYETPVDMIRTLWWKFMVNVGMNPPSAVLRAPYGVFQECREAQALMETLMHEVIDLAQVAGVDLHEGDLKNWYTFMHTLSPHGKTSMLQDIEAGRKTEIEIFAGKVVELGQTYDIPTPVNETLLRMVQVLEAGCDWRSGKH